jgi:hypothetical protein
MAFVSPAATISARRNPARSNLLSNDSENRNRTNVPAPAAAVRTSQAKARGARCHILACVNRQCRSDSSYDPTRTNAAFNPFARPIASP